MTTTPTTKQRTPTKAGVIIVSVLIVLTVLACMGVIWQWQRSQFHQNLAETARAQISAPHSPEIAANGTLKPGLIKLQGRWIDGGGTTFVSPRILNGVYGAWAVSVFQHQEGQGKATYFAVHRGWVPQTSPNQIPTVDALPTGLVSIVGYAEEKLGRVYELKAQLMNGLGLWQNYSRTAHASILSLDLSSSIVVLTQSTINDASAGRLKRIDLESMVQQWQQKADSNTAYAFQWLGLAIVGVFGLLWMWRTRSRSRINETSK